MTNYTFVQKITKVGDLKISYWDNNKTWATKTIVLLAPGSRTGEFFREFVPYFPSHLRLIAPDFPGRGKSDVLPEKDSINLFANIVLEFIKDLHLQMCTIFGVSFGTAVANEMVKIDERIFKKVILIAPGEYFNDTKVLFFKVLFFPALYSEFVRQFYRQIINKLGFYGMNFRLPRRNLKSILGQPVNIPAVKRIYI